ncbi:MULTISPECIES: ABC transporter ATP-binding protein [Xanthobacter]|uniref:ABC transporter ATP-binding protein n=1 Tax=Xanthobacter TaxID=279 RepID=UPI001DCDDCEB|nr:branched-chain amino acid transport system ATP-binding protein [Xanthobacter flavus]
MPEALTLSNLHVYHGEICAVRGLDIVCAEGAVTALLGRNGAGKSTTLSAIAGLLDARQGRIDLFGTSLENRKPEVICRLGVGLVPQGRRIFPSLTVQEHLAIAYRPPRHKAARVFDIASVETLFPRLKERRRQLAGSMSGGEQQMLAIARALVTNPRVLLLDEPAEGLAPQIVAEVADAIAALKQAGLSILLVEHNLPLALRLADTCVVLSSGEVVWRGPPQVLADDPALMAQHLGVH